MSDRSRSPARVWRTEADLDRADLDAALRHAREVGYELIDARAELAAERAALTAARNALVTAQAALATAQAALEAERVCRAADQEWAAARRQQWMDSLRETFRDCTDLAVLARGAGVSSDLIDYWYRAPAPAEPEPDPEPDPE
jgi:hypothetical protein